MGWFREVSVKLLFKPFERSGLSANKITVLNFLILELATVILFFFGYEILGLAIAVLAAMVDFIDGSVARARGGNTKLGQYLDTSLDWLYLMLLMGAISYHHNILPIGYLALIAITWGNWVEYNGNSKCRTPFLLTTTNIIGISILVRHAGLGIILVALVQWCRTVQLYRRSVWK